MRSTNLLLLLLLLLLLILLLLLLGEVTSLAEPRTAVLWRAISFSIAKDETKPECRLNISLIDRGVRVCQH